MSIALDVSADLDAAAVSLDIPPEIAQEAEYEYRRIASWLGADDSALLRFDPDLYPQGSFKLGTPIRPIIHDDEFDIDLVCHLDIQKELVTQKELKALVGDRLKLHDDLKDRLQERRRCWTIRFPGLFHLDILPTIPDPAHLSEGVLLTDRELHFWQHSNPLEYAVWFYDRMRPMVLEQQERLAKSANVTIADIPEWRVRTPLQRAVQILKRHRDEYFRTALDDRPVSIIITTLAAHAYAQQPDLGQTLAHLAAHMADQVQYRSGRWEVLNPAHPAENFADKWNERPALRQAFVAWIAAVQRDVAELQASVSSPARMLLLEKSLGATVGSGTSQALLRRRVDTTGDTAARIVVPAPDSIAHIQPVPWLADLRYACTVRGQSTRGRGSTKNRRALSEWVPKRAGLEFRATTDTPPPFQVQWQITNTGAEARRRGQLRGGFYAGEGTYGAVRTEAAAYGGTHLVQAFVLKDGILVARSERLQVLVPV